ncbi:MAG: S8 family serine peptidase [Gammaproteobacteria bacterium]|nr:S8 family serine peptidase [Gammaproteobacteria bacterium]
MSDSAVISRNNQRASSKNRTAEKFEYLPDMIVVKFKDCVSFGERATATGITSVDALFSRFGVYEMKQVLKESALKPGIDRTVAVESIYNLKFNSNADAADVARTFSRNPHIEYAEPKRLCRFFDIPNDPQYNIMSQFPHVQAPAAWDVVKGEQGNVIIAVPDGGAEWRHEDLVDNIWNNLGEDADGDGHTIEHNGVSWEFDPGDINGSDDDGNGFIDDFIGWNFNNNSSDPTGLPHPMIFNYNVRHGTATAGIAAAVTNNNIGVASLSWNCKLMPINVSHESIGTWYQLWGFEGIAYAAANGADVLSTSWGGYGFSSHFEQDMIDFAYYNGTLVVSAVGNGGPNGIGFDIDLCHSYPANYKHVLGVGATYRSNDIKAPYSNYGVTTDVFAPGVDINTTYPNNQYSNNGFGGTSSASPMAAALAGLVKTQNPTFTVDQVREQVRVTCNPIELFNPGLEGKLGKGRINALRAVTDFTIPSIRIASVSFTDSGGDSIIDAGETVDLSIDFINYLAATGNVNVTLSVEDSNITVTNGIAIISSINTNQVQTLNFQCDVGQDVPQVYILRFYIDIADGTYSDRDFFDLMVTSPRFLDHDTGVLQTSITTRGNIGFVYSNGGPGSGFVHENDNYLYEAGLLVATDVNHISDCIRNEWAMQEMENDFRPAARQDLIMVSPGQFAHEEGSIVLVDSLAEFPIGVAIKQQSFADNRIEYRNFVIFKYTIINNNNVSVSNLHAGLFFDWNINPNILDDARYDPSRKMGYVLDNVASPTKIAACRLLTDNSNISYASIQNIDWNVGLTDQQKWNYLSGGIQTQTINNANVSTMLAEGPFTIPAGDSIEVAFTVIGAGSLAELHAAGDSAQSFYYNPPLGIVTPTATDIPTTYSLSQNYPNPFNPNTTIKIALPQAEFVTLKIYNIIGQEVATLVSKKLVSGTYNYKWDASGFASGLYFYQLITEKGFVQTRKLVLLR